MSEASSSRSENRTCNCDGPEELTGRESKEWTTPAVESDVSDQDGSHGDVPIGQVQETLAVERRHTFDDSSPPQLPRVAAPTAPASRRPPLHSQIYILRVCRALMMYGAPTHRLENYMQRSAEALQLSLQAFYLPSCMIISFDESGPSQRSIDVQIITCLQSLNLGKLRDVHHIYKDMIHRRTDAKEATNQLDDIIIRQGEHPRWLRVVMYGLASACIGPVSYNARPVDLPLIFLLGSIVGLLDLVVTEKSVLYGYVFEMTSAILTSFVARALGSFQWGKDNHSFCFSAIAQASLVLILPGFIVTNSALELQSRMMISGAVRLVYAIIYTLFLAFGFIVGISVYGAMGMLNQLAASQAKAETRLRHLLTFYLEILDSDATSSTTCADPWPFWWQVTFVIPFTFCYVIVNQAKWRQIPATLVVTLAGWLVNHFSAERFTTIASLPNALGALTIGLLSNLYSRLGYGLALEVMHPAIFILVPGSFAASGSLIDGLQSANALTRQSNNGTDSGTFDASGRTSALYAGYAMVEIAIGITAGLSVSALLIYPFRKNHGAGGLFAY